MRDRWGREITEEQARALLRWEKPGAKRRAGVTQANGYASTPGSGPAGETCGSCRFLHRNEQAKTYLKCTLMSRYWTGGRKTDVLARSPACSQWSEREREHD